MILWLRSTVWPTVGYERGCKSMTGVGIEPTTYGLKVRPGLQTPCSNPENAGHLARSLLT